jgi:hypothetical protein
VVLARARVRVVEGWDMAFGQASGSPATGQQVRELIELLGAAGHSGFRDARGPMGFTQRQAGGKFTRDEAEAFIERLNAEAHDAHCPQEFVAPAKRPTATASTVESVRLDAATRQRLMARAERDGTTISEVVEQALHAYL